MAKGRKTGGRVAGTPNKLTATVKEMLLTALENKGGVKYLEEQAEKNPQAFMTLLGKIVPTQVVGDLNHRFVARIPAPVGDTKEWLQKYSPKPQTQTH